MLRSMGAARKLPVHNAPCSKRVFLKGCWAGGREEHAARLGQPREESHGSLTAPISMRRGRANEPNPTLRPRWRGGLTSTETSSQGSGTIVHGNLGKASRDEVICWFLANWALWALAA